MRVMVLLLILWVMTWVVSCIYLWLNGISSVCLAHALTQASSMFVSANSLIVFRHLPHNDAKFKVFSNQDMLSKIASYCTHVEHTCLGSPYNNVRLSCLWYAGECLCICACAIFKAMDGGMPWIAGIHYFERYLFVFGCSVLALWLFLECLDRNQQEDGATALHQCPYMSLYLASITMLHDSSSSVPAAVIIHASYHTKLSQYPLCLIGHLSNSRACYNQPL